MYSSVAIPVPTTSSQGLVRSILRHIDFAFQPIVSAHTGEAFGFEALMRGQELMGSSSIAGFLKDVASDGVLLGAELALHERAITQFLGFAGDSEARLFVNLNNAAFTDPEYAPEQSTALLRRLGIHGSRLCLEVSEAQILDVPRSLEMLRGWEERPLIALDDFGTGYSGLRLLAESKPDLIKVDRFFVAGVEHDQERRLFLTQIVSLAHTLGMRVVAEGVETEEEFRIAREVGCDFMQGYFIAYPTVARESISMHYPIVEQLNRKNRQNNARARSDIRSHIDTVAAISIDSPVITLLDAFMNDKSRSFFPIVTEAGAPLGIVHEEGLKSLIYSQYGRDLLVNRVRPRNIRDFLTTTLSFDVNTTIDHILNTIANRPDDYAILITERNRYIGLLDARGIIRTMHDRLLTLATDQNPLTKLPGNVMVADYITETIDRAVTPAAFVYFDFDNFKPFNDQFGFRQGDRAIAMFSELMRNHMAAPDIFLGHIGGDDFFLGVTGPRTEAVVARVEPLIAQFSSDVESFYDEPTRRAGMVDIVDRYGVAARVPLLSVSCGVIVIGENATEVTQDVVAATLAKLKKTAKASVEKIAFARFSATTGGQGWI